MCIPPNPTPHGGLLLPRPGDRPVLERWFTRLYLTAYITFLVVGIVKVLS